MSRIDELIAEHCPEGVEFQTLDEMGVTYGGLTGKTKIDFNDGNARFISYKNIFKNLAVDIGAKDFVRVADGENQNSVMLGDVLFTGSSETPDEVGMSSVVIEVPPEETYLNSFCFGYRFNDATLLLPGFSKYIFRSDTVRQKIVMSASGVTRFNISKKRFLKVRIPVPPLEVQREIVKVLDTFTALTAELEAELEARRRQYQYYRDALLSFEGREDVRWTMLGKIGKWYGGGTPSKGRPDYWTNGTIPWVSPKDMGRPIIDSAEDYITDTAIKESSTKLVPANSVALVVRSSILDKFLPSALISVPVALNQDMKAVITEKEIMPAYIAHILRSSGPEILRAARKTGGSVASIDSGKLFAFRIPIPPLEEQARIVAILDKFDALVNDLSSGLPAEIKARRQQYEHYRDRLLSFPQQTDHQGGMA